MTQVTIFGIPNCNTMKKARDWLATHHIDHVFHNYKKEGIDTEHLQSWAKHVSWDLLLNKRGTTWRKLSDADKEDVDQHKAIALMQANPSMIKRPVLVIHDGGKPVNIQIGFAEGGYHKLLDKLRA